MTDPNASRRASYLRNVLPSDADYKQAKAKAHKLWPTEQTQRNEQPMTAATISNLSDILNIFSAWGPESPSYRPWLFGPRHRGSTTEACITTLSDRPVLPFTPVEGATVKGAQYFMVHAPELGGRQGAIAMSELSVELMPLLSLRTSEATKCATTGKEIVTKEFYLDRTLEEAKAYGMPRQADMLVIIGPEGDPWTWYPMPCLAAFTVNGLANNEANVGNVAVKLHNG